MENQFNFWIVPIVFILVLASMIVIAMFAEEDNKSENQNIILPESPKPNELPILQQHKYNEPLNETFESSILERQNFMQNNVSIEDKDLKIREINEAIKKLEMEKSMIIFSKDNSINF